MIGILFGTWRRRFFTLLLCLLSFGASLFAALSVGLMRSPSSANAVKQIPVIGALAVSYTESRLGPPNAPPPEPEDVRTYRELMPVSAEAITELIENLKEQRQLYLDKIADLERSEKRINIYRNELAEERKQIQLLKDQIVERWEKIKTAGDTLNQKVTELNRVEAENLKHLAATYESMKPDRAALIMKKLDEATATKTLYLMRRRCAAKIMEHLDHETAAQLTRRMILIKRTN